MLSCYHDLLFLFCLLLFYLFLHSMGWLCEVGVFGLIVFSLFLGLTQQTPNNNNMLCFDGFFPSPEKLHFGCKKSIFSHSF